MSIIKKIARSLERKKLRRSKKNLSKEILRVSGQSRFKPGYTSVFGKPFRYHDNLSFIDSYHEIFTNEIYRFASKDEYLIIDCGANMGISVLFFSLNYPNHRIVAFEPDPLLFAILSENVDTFSLQNVELFNQAVWTEKTTLDFFTDGGLGGRVNQPYSKQQPVKVQGIDLADFIGLQKVDFLKIDIEGSETAVIKNLAKQWPQINYLFFEYHNSLNSKQTLHELLEIVRQQGFTYYIKESSVINRPFIDRPVICEAYDMALNVFCYKNGQIQ